MIGISFAGALDGARESALSERHFDAVTSSVVLNVHHFDELSANADRWNALLREALAVVRSTNPARTVIVGLARWNIVEALPTLGVPGAFDATRHAWRARSETLSSAADVRRDRHRDCCTSALMALAT